jgi:hypothetical protein
MLPCYFACGTRLTLGFTGRQVSRSNTTVQICTVSIGRMARREMAAYIVLTGFGCSAGSRFVRVARFRIRILDFSAASVYIDGEHL